MKKYEKPLLIKENIELEDIIAASVDINKSFNLWDKLGNTNNNIDTTND